jgi:hypothetical protein
MRPPFFNRVPSCAVKPIAALTQWVFGAAVVSVVLLVLSRADSHPAGPEPDAAPGSGIVMRTEVTTVWVPPALVDLAHRATDSSVARSRDELKTYIDINDQSRAWYALVCRGHQVNGGVADLAQIRRSDEWSGRFEEFQDMLSAVAGRPPREGGLDFSSATVGVIPDELLAADPREAVAHLTDRPGCSR